MAKKRLTGARVTRAIWHTRDGNRIEMAGGVPIGIVVGVLCISCTEEELTELETKIAEIRKERTTDN